MLRRDVIEAVETGQFHIYPVDHVDLCLELLTGLPAGERGESGEFPQGSVNQTIRERLLDLAAKRRTYSGAGPAREEDANAGKTS
jgi:predicted ATP-dependent protease